MIQRLTRALATLVLFVLLAVPAAAHITPPVVLASDRDTLVNFLAGSKKYFVREVRLTPQERDALRQRVGWNPDEDFYRFYLGRTDAGGLVAATVFLTEYTIHGPVRVAVALDADGKVKGARVVELTEETYPWVKPLIDQNFTQNYVGQDSRGKFTLASGTGDTMTQFYGQIVASLVQRAAALYDVALGKRAADAGVAPTSGG
jgi:Na+-translocating ferredoxin:NAD+ oxidoreductase RnfG subunit